MADTQKQRSTADDGNDGTQVSFKGKERAGWKKDLWKNLVGKNRWISMVGLLCILAFAGGFSKLIFFPDEKTAVSLVASLVAILGILLLIGIFRDPVFLSRLRQFKASGVEVTLDAYQAYQEQVKQVVSQQYQVNQRIDEHQTKLKEQQDLINDLVKFSMSRFVFRHLCGIAFLYEYKFENTEEIRREMGFLKDNGFIQSKKPKTFVDINATLANCNLVDHVELTPIGWFCIKARQGEAELLLEGWLEQNETNVKKYVWEEVRKKKPPYPYYLPERIAVREIAERNKSNERESTNNRIESYLRFPLQVVAPTSVQEEKYKEELEGELEEELEGKTKTFTERTKVELSADLQNRIQAIMEALHDSDAFNGHDLQSGTSKTPGSADGETSSLTNAPAPQAVGA